MADTDMEVEQPGEQNAALIDPIYEKFTKSVLRAIGSTEFYDFFMDAVSKANTQIQFSNRQLRKTVDLRWVDEIERALPAIQNIISMPRNVIKEEELVVNAAHAKKAGPDVVRHLTQHAAYVEDYREDTGDVRPSRLMQKFREDSEELYENRLAFTAMEMAYHFVKIRHDALLEVINDEYGAKLKIDVDMQSDRENVRLESFLHIKEIESIMDADQRNEVAFGRISRLYRLLSSFMGSKFAQDMAKTNRVKGALIKTNILKKNPNYRTVERLFSFMRNYEQIGYTIQVIEQSPEISEKFQQDIYHNVLFNYMLLKGYLENDKDRVIDTKAYEKKRSIKPVFIRQIIEELTEDYDLPDVEIRKVLIEELTKEQLMHEEAEKRRQLVEEQARKRKAEQERIRKEKAAERERIRQEKAAERERIRQEKEMERQRILYEKMLRENEDRRRGDIFREELSAFANALEERLEARREWQLSMLAQQEDFADAAQLLEEAEQRKLEMLERQRIRREEELQRQRMEEEIRLERLRLEQQEQLERQIAQDMETLQQHNSLLRQFMENLEDRKQLRRDYIQRQEEYKLRLEQERNRRLAKRAERIPQ